MKRFILLFQLGFLVFSSQLWAQTSQVVDIPTRPSVTQRMVVLRVDKPKATVVLLRESTEGFRSLRVAASNGAREISWCAHGNCSRLMA